MGWHRATASSARATAEAPAGHCRRRRRRRLFLNGDGYAAAAAVDTTTPTPPLCTPAAAVETQRAVAAAAAAALTDEREEEAAKKERDRPAQERRSRAQTASGWVRRAAATAAIFAFAAAAVLAFATAGAAADPNPKASLSDLTASPALAPPSDHANYHYFAFQLHPRSVPEDDTDDSSALADTTSSSISSSGSLESHARSLHRRSAAFHSRAEAIAADLGVHFVGRVGALPDYFQVAVRRRNAGDGGDALEKRDDDDAADAVRAFLDEHPDVVWVERQVPRQRLFKRSFADSDGKLPPIVAAASTPKKHRQLAAPAPARRIDSAAAAVKDAVERFGILDPLFPKQWHLINQVPDERGNDINVTGIWEQGIFGENVTVCFVDDGIDYTNDDIKLNFYEGGSYDYNDHVKLPTPRTPEDRHGTRCAGEVAAVKNDVCGIGIAFKARVSGVRILSGPLTEADEAAAINYDMQNNHIYSCSWGPADNGMAMEGPPKIVADAVINGIVNGRGGLGSVFVFASGNGGGFHDNCNFDGYTNSIFTITVSAIDRKNQHPTYSELCSANMVVMYSSATQRSEDSITTTDWQIGHTGENLCTSGHGGTSAAAPIVSGIFALVLSIRPDLSWRDMQHLTVNTAIPISTTDPSWQKTAAGYLYSHKFGFGKMSAYAIVEAAKTWVNVRKQTHYTSPLVIVNQTIPQDPPGADVRAQVVVVEKELASVGLARLEHITVTVTIRHQRRGDVQVDLVSPNGVVSNVGVKRVNDNDPNGFKNWTFMTVAHWNENPLGTWEVVVTDNANPAKTGVFESVYLTFWGESVPDSTTPAPPTTTTTTAATTHKPSLSATTLPTKPTSAIVGGGGKDELPPTPSPSSTQAPPPHSLPPPHPAPSSPSSPLLLALLASLTLAVLALAAAFFCARDSLIAFLRRRAVQGRNTTFSTAKAAVVAAVGQPVGGGGGGGGGARGAAATAGRGAGKFEGGGAAGRVQVEEDEDLEEFEMDEKELGELERGGYLKAADEMEDDEV
ncbi:peptidase S8/S53 domain-containing protein [Zopfochytrium polystomum]|nr:peptidase S8/S53 domain-containing protein [Zopfochytrium polystomum]